MLGLRRLCDPQRTKLQDNTVKIMHDKRVEINSHCPECSQVQ